MQSGKILRHIKLVCWTVSVILLLEITARLYFFGLDGFSYTKLDSFHAIGESGLLRISANPGISIELKPNLDTYFKLEKFSTNSDGFRDKEYVLEKPFRTFRVAVLGASYVMGAGVPSAETFHSILEDRLNRESKDTVYEFINMGVGGHSPWETLAMLKGKALKYRPDLVLFGTSPRMYKHGRQGPVEKLRPVRHPFFNSFFLEPFKIGVTRFVKAAGNKGPSATNEEIRNNIKAVFQELGDLQKETNIPVWVVILEHREDSFQIIPEMEGLASAYGLLIVDAASPFAGKSQMDFCSNKLDCHPNARAHQVFADSVHSFLKERYLRGKINFTSRAGYEPRP